MQTPDVAGKHHLGHEVYAEWVERGKILIFTLPNSHQATLDIYIEASLESLKMPPPDEPYFVMHDLTSREVVFTPYMRKHLERVSDYIREQELHGYAAIILTKTITSQILVNYSRIFSKRSKVQQVLFTNPDKGLAWLKEKLVAHQL